MKRVISIAVTLLMLLTCIPGMAFAAEPASALRIMQDGEDVTGKTIEMRAYYGTRTISAVDAEGASAADVTWTSSDPAVTVSAGKITTKDQTPENDVATITAKDGAGNTAVCSVKLTPIDISDKTAAKFKSEYLSIQKLATTQYIDFDCYDESGGSNSDLTQCIMGKLTCIGSTHKNVVKPENAEFRIVRQFNRLWVTASDFGNTTLTFGSDDKFITGNLTLDVTADGIWAVPSRVHFEPKESKSLGVILGSALKGQEVTYKSSDETIATVSADGTVTAHKNGDAVITVTCGEHTENCSVSVVKNGFYIDGDYLTGTWVGKDAMEWIARKGDVLALMYYEDGYDMQMYNNPYKTVSGNTSVAVIGEGWSSGSVAKIVANGDGTAQLYFSTSGETVPLKVTITGTGVAPDPKAGMTQVEDPQSNFYAHLLDREFQTQSYNETYFENYLIEAVDPAAADFSFKIGSDKPSGANILKPEKYDQYEAEQLEHIAIYETDGKELGEKAASWKDGYELTADPEYTMYGDRGPAYVTMKIKAGETALEYGKTYALVFEKEIYRPMDTAKMAPLCLDLRYVYYFNTIPKQAESITLDKTELTMEVGSSEPLAATVDPENTVDKTVTWISSDESVATVDAEGNVTAVKEGKVTITAETANGLKASCDVTVVPAAGGDGDGNGSIDEPAAGTDSSKDKTADQNRDGSTQTGDDTNLMFFFGLMIAAAIAAGVLLLRRKRNA